MGHEGPLVALWAIKHGVDQMKLPSWMEPVGEVVGLRTAEEENEWHTGVGLGYANIPDVDHADDYTAGNVAYNMVAHELDREREKRHRNDCNTGYRLQWGNHMQTKTDRARGGIEGVVTSGQ